MRYYEVAPNGDVVLVLRRKNMQLFSWSYEETDDETFGRTAGVVSDRDCARFRLSSRHLIRKSPVFRAMLCGGWKESFATREDGVRDGDDDGSDDDDDSSSSSNNNDDNDSSNNNNNNNNRQDEALLEITATNWDKEAFLLLMNLLHGSYRNVPLRVSLLVLVKVCILVDYYMCQEATRFFVGIWMNHLNDIRNAPYGHASMGWLFVSWVFSQTAMFESMTEAAMMQSTVPVSAFGLPLPHWLINVMESKRTKALRRIISHIRHVSESLVQGKQGYGCGRVCSSRMNESLMKAMSSIGISNLPLTAPYGNVSVQMIKDAVRTLRTETRTKYHEPGTRMFSPECNIHVKLQPVIKSVCGGYQGLKLEDYCHPWLDNRHQSLWSYSTFA
ncbi:hypothetical protein E4U21_000612 [Claviceps maximensis]|nr:hypothetical protein E4U21_000612 [Claviceps maximensis]